MKCPHGVSPKSNCDICRKEYRRKYQKKYQQSPKYKEHKRKYMKEYYMRLHSSKVLNPTPVKPATTISGREPLKSLKSKKVSETGGRLGSEV